MDQCSQSKQIDLTNFASAISKNLLNGSKGANDSMLAGELDAARKALNMYEHYTIHLRGSCGWNGQDMYAKCTAPTSNYWFNPVTVWGLNSSASNLPLNQLLPGAFQAGLDTYQKVSKAMYVTFIIAFAATGLTLLVGISAIFSRWGSFITVFFAATSSIFTVASASIAVGMFATLRTVLNNELSQDYGIKSDLGQRGLTVFWVGAAAAFAAGMFWSLSVCCCSGRSPYNPGSKDARRTRAEKTPYTYERVGSPYLGPHGGQPAVPLTNMGPAAHAGYSTGPAIHREPMTAYEPFRPQGMA